jgi:hypothetical protein
MNRIVACAIAMGVLTACAPAVPDSGRGVGFDNSIEAQRAREAALTGQQPASALPPPGAVSAETIPAPGPGIRRPAPAQSATPGAPLAAPTSSASQSGDAILEAAASLEQREANSGVDPLQASPSNPAPSLEGNPALSDENDFEAVAARESIQSDAQRIQQNREQFQVVQPTAVPTRSGTSQPNIVDYALRTRHPVGTRLYARAGINLAARSQRNCAQYASPDLAQIDFLSSGGPERDRKALDPDGDGYACGWNPAPFRAAVQN